MLQNIKKVDKTRDSMLSASLRLRTMRREIARFGAINDRRRARDNLMKKKSITQSAFFNPRVLIGFLLCLTSVLIALIGVGLYSGPSAQAQGKVQAQEAGGAPEVIP